MIINVLQGRLAREGCSYRLMDPRVKLDWDMRWRRGGESREVKGRERNGKKNEISYAKVKLKVETVS